MIFPFMLLIADIFLWWLALDVMSLGDTLINIGMFGLAFGGFIWVVMESLDLAAASRGDDS
tara:strand:- start:101 stop:283 length:183 start_codon:yes stop_codon:yes gene_type:complete